MAVAVQDLKRQLPLALALIYVVYIDSLEQTCRYVLINTTVRSEYRCLQASMKRYGKGGL